jgi:hypothetical protein
VVVDLARGPNGGLTLPEEALVLALDLENRGCTLRQDGDRLRVLGPGGAKPALSEGDVEAIRRWKAHLLALLAYVAPENIG